MQTIAINTLKTRFSEFLTKLTESGEPIYITRHGQIVAKLAPCNKEQAREKAKKRLKGSILRYDDPAEPVGVEDWEALDDHS